MKNYPRLLLSVLLITGALLTACKKKEEPPEPEYPFKPLAHIPADEVFIDLVPWTDGKMLGLTARGAVWRMDELTLDSLTAISDYRIGAMHVSGDILLAMGVQADENYLIRFDLVSKQVQTELFDPLTGDNSYYPAHVYLGANGTEYAVFHKDVSFLVDARSKLYRRASGGPWEVFTVSRSGGGFFNLGGAISSVGEDANGTFWLGTADKGLGLLGLDSIRYYERPNQASTGVTDLLPLGTTLYLQIDDLPYSFSNEQFTAINLVPISSISNGMGVLRKNQDIYFLYHDGIYRRTSGNLHTFFQLERDLIGEQSGSNDLRLGATDSNLKIWLYIEDLGIFTSDVL